MTKRTGKCMCGAVEFTAQDVPEGFGICHCEMCRRWTGSALMAVSVPVKGVTWKGEAHVRTLQSSDWAERAWCQRCGTGLYYHVTADGPMTENYEIPIGLFDDTEGLVLKREIYIDHKPSCFDSAGDHQRMTRSEVLEMLGVPEAGL